MNRFCAANLELRLQTSKSFDLILQTISIVSVFLTKTRKFQKKCKYFHFCAKQLERRGALQGHTLTRYRMNQCDRLSVKHQPA